MGTLVWVDVPPQADHSKRSEAKRNRTRATERGGSVERNCEPMGKNRIEGAAEQGEWAMNREALLIKAKWRQSDGCAVKRSAFLPGKISPHG